MFDRVILSGYEATFSQHDPTGIVRYVVRDSDGTCVLLGYASDRETAIEQVKDGMTFVAKVTGYDTVGMIFPEAQA